MSGSPFITIPKNRGIKRVRITANAVFTQKATGSRLIEIGPLCQPGLRHLLPNN